MNLDLSPTANKIYKSGPQIVRVVTEEWGTNNLYCPACDSNGITKALPNTPTIDFTCPKCSQTYQLKNRRDSSENKIVDAAYSTMIAAIRNDNTPNLFLLQYSITWKVQNMLLIPHFFITESIIEKRKPLSPLARHAGWIGCNILVREIPKDGKLRIVSDGTEIDPAEARKQFQLIKPFADLNVRLRGWTLDVFRIIRRLNKTGFSLSDAYKYDGELAAIHPDNKNIRAKIRQQLQILRDLEFLIFTTRGHYSLNV
jgi:type II restriction enzyme